MMCAGKYTSKKNHFAATGRERYDWGMNILRLLPTILSLLVLGAHYLRSGPYLFVLILLGLPFLLFIKKAWVARLMQVVLILGALEWIRTTYNLIVERQLFGEPWTRMAIILGTVAAVAAASAFSFQSKALKERYGLGEKKTLQ